MNINIVSDTASFKLLLNDWKILFSLSEHTIFQSFEFNYYSWKGELSNDLDNKLKKNDYNYFPKRMKTIKESITKIRNYENKRISQKV